jgi:DNA-binding response OmpR family regulator
LVLKGTAEVARRAASGCPLALVLGIGRRSRTRLDVIPVFRAVRSELPVIVIADEDSLELERRARQAGIFYYLVHPLDSREVKAVLEDLLRHAGSRRHHGGVPPRSPVSLED